MVVAYTARTPSSGPIASRGFWDRSFLTLNVSLNHTCEDVDKKSPLRINFSYYQSETDLGTQPI